MGSRLPALGCLEPTGRKGTSVMIRDGTSGWVYCYYNNDYHGYALDNASQLEALVGEKG